MKSEKPKAKETTEQRQIRDRLEFDRLVAEVEQNLEHRSDGIWDWWDETVDEVGGAVGEAAGAVGDWIGGVADNVGAAVGAAVGGATDWIEGAVANAGNAIGSAAANINGWVDETLWNTGPANAKLEGWVRDTFDVPDQAGKGFIGEAWDKIMGRTQAQADDVECAVKEAEGKINDGAGGPGGGEPGGGGGGGSIIDRALLWLSAGFEAAMLAIAGLPDLIYDLKDELSGFFQFDPAEYQATLDAMKAAQQDTDQPKAPSVVYEAPKVKPKPKSPITLVTEPEITEL